MLYVLLLLLLLLLLVAPRPAHTTSARRRPPPRAAGLNKPPSPTPPNNNSNKHKASPPSTTTVCPVTMAAPARSRRDVLLSESTPEQAELLLNLLSDAAAGKELSNIVSDVVQVYWLLDG